MIRTQGLTYAYAAGTTLHFADVAVPQGGVLLLKGPSGAGKSTWLALAAGLVAPSQGQMEVAGQVLAGGSTDRWRARNIGFLPQKLHLSPALSVHDNLALAQWAAGQAEDAGRIASALAALGVGELVPLGVSVSVPLGDALGVGVSCKRRNRRKSAPPRSAVLPATRINRHTRRATAFMASAGA